MYFVMSVNPCPGAGASSQPAGNTGLFRWFLCVQLGVGFAELFPGLIGPRLCLLRLFPFPCPRPFAVCFAGFCSCPGLPGAVSGRRLPLTAEPFRGPGPLFILPEFLLPRLRANLARGGFFPCPVVRFPFVLKPQAGGSPRLLFRAGWGLFPSGGLRANLARSVRLLFGCPVCKLCDKTDLLSLKMKYASQYLWTLNWHTSLLNWGCGIGM